ncbi:MAG: hypothetical protein J5658_06630 [Prevotella sp.]|nr:hypothetical protein [Prevotella sp.]
MESNKNYWTTGEIITLKRTEKPLKNSGWSMYGQYIGSRYICIREDSERQHGILLKVLGKAYSDQVRMVGGEAFSVDDSDELFMGHHYFSYPFPKPGDLKEVLDILRGDNSLLQKFEDAKMHINPNSKYWVNETSRNMLMMKVPQVYDSSDDLLHNPSSDTAYYRISIVYFHRGGIVLVKNLCSHILDNL